MGHHAVNGPIPGQVASSGEIWAANHWPREGPASSSAVTSGHPLSWTRSPPVADPYRSGNDPLKHPTGPAQDMSQPAPDPDGRASTCSLLRTGVCPALAPYAPVHCRSSIPVAPRAFVCPCSPSGGRPPLPCTPGATRGEPQGETGMCEERSRPQRLRGASVQAQPWSGSEAVDGAGKPRRRPH